MAQEYLKQVVAQFPDLEGEVKETHIVHPDFLFIAFPSSEQRGQFLKHIREHNPPPFYYQGQTHVIRMTAARPKELRDKEKEMKASYWLLSEAVKKINPNLPP